MAKAEDLTHPPGWVEPIDHNYRKLSNGLDPWPERRPSAIVIVMDQEGVWAVSYPGSKRILKLGYCYAPIFETTTWQEPHERSATTPEG